MPYRFIMVIGLALLPTTMAGCANQEAFTAADCAKCQQLGFTPGTQHYDTCLSNVQQQRTAGGSPRLNHFEIRPQHYLHPVPIDPNKRASASS